MKACTDLNLNMIVKVQRRKNDVQYVPGVDGEQRHMLLGGLMIMLSF